MCFEIVGYLLEELRDPDNFASFKEDLASANVFIGSLIFIEELAEKVRGRARGCGGGQGAHGARRRHRLVALMVEAAGLEAAAVAAELWFGFHRANCCGSTALLHTLRSTHGRHPPHHASTRTPAPCSQIVEAVAPVRERLDACVIFPSMPAVMKLNKLGTFSMAQLGQSKSMIGEFIK